MGSKIVKKIRSGRAEKTFFTGVLDSAIPREFVSKTTGGVRPAAIGVKIPTR